MSQDAWPPNSNGSTLQKINSVGLTHYATLFTSLRDGNRPHRIVGLTQQGHDSGADLGTAGLRTFRP